MEAKTKLAGLAAVSLLLVVPIAAQEPPGIQIRSIATARTPSLRSVPPTPPQWHPGNPPREIPLRSTKRPRGGGGGGGGGGPWTDADLQAGVFTRNFTTSVPFQGQNFTGAIPPDTNLSVGGIDPVSKETEIAQIVNTSYAVYNVSGAAVLPSTDLSALFNNLPPTANCNANGDGGDTVVLWDRSDGHWLIGQLAYNSTFTQIDYCLAISDTTDAAGTYHVYDISFGGSLPDYPKLAVWSDGIYFSANMFKLKVNRFTGAISSTFLGAQACSFPRPTSTPLASVTFTCSGSGNTAIYNILPADVDGSTAPVGGSDYYLQFVDNLSSTSGNELTLYQFQAGKLVALGNLTVATFHEACGGAICVPQLGTPQQLDSLGDRLMYRLAYRDYGSSQAMVVNHSVQVSSSSQQAGVRWYMLCSQTGPPPFRVCKESTFSPDVSTYRWMGSIAQNSAGDLGLGYSVSSDSAYPGVAVTGLESSNGGGAGDGGMEMESVIFPGPNFQDTYSRWGDYSSMVVDPNDDCTFWYTTEYSTTTNLFGIDNFFWGTVIGSFHFRNCTPNP